MATVRTCVFLHLDGGPVPAGLPTMTNELRNQLATFAYGHRNLARPDRVPVDPVACLFMIRPATAHSGPKQASQVLGGIRDATPVGWGSP